MQLSVDQLLKGIIYSVDQLILPGLSSSYLKAQAVAISSSLTNLATRLAASDPILLDQNRSLRVIFQTLEKILISSNDLHKDEASIELRRKIETQLAKAYTAKQPLTEENYDLKVLLEEVIGRVWEIEDRTENVELRKMHDQIRHFLHQEVETELSLLTAPDMGRVSKG